MKVFKNGFEFWRVAALAIIALMSFVAATAQSTDSAAVSPLLKQAKVHAAQAQDDAVFLDANSMSALAWQIDIQRLKRIQEHLKDLQKDLAELQARREEASPQQQAAIDRFEYLMSDPSPQIIDAMWWVYRNQNRINMPPFRSRAHELMIAVDKVHRHLRECTSRSSTTYFTAQVTQH